MKGPYPSGTILKVSKYFIKSYLNNDPGYKLTQSRWVVLEDGEKVKRLYSYTPAFKVTVWKDFEEDIQPKLEDFI